MILQQDCIITDGMKAGNRNEQIPKRVALLISGVAASDGTERLS